MMIMKYAELVIAIFVIATTAGVFYLGQRSIRVAAKYEDRMSRWDKSSSSKTGQNFAPGAKLCFKPPPEMNLVEDRSHRQHATFGELKMTMHVNRLHYMIALAGFIFLSLVALSSFMYVWENPDQLSGRDFTAAFADMCIWILALLSAIIFFFWGRERLLFYEYGMVRCYWKSKEYPYAAIDNINLEKREIRSMGYLVGCKIVAVIISENAPLIEINGNILANFVEKIKLWQQYLVRD